MLHRMVLILALCGACFAQCSQDMVRGTWGYYSQGTLLVTVPGSAAPTPVPVVGLGIQKIDYQGQFTVQSTLNAGGQVQSGTFSGSIQVNPDCTATDTYSIPGVPGKGTDRLLILGNGTEMRLMPMVGALGPMTALAYYRRISWGDPQCTSDMVHGVYGGTADGLFLMAVAGQSQPVAMPYSGILAMTFPYTGKGTGAATTSIPGTFLDWSFPEAVVAVNADCTGTIKWKAAPKGSPQVGSGSDNIIVLSNGDELWSLQTQNYAGVPIIIEKYRRISTLPVAPNW